jgi:hypothetical protein
MIHRVQQLCDLESAGVFAAAAGSVAARLSGLNTALTTIVLVGTVIYTWRKALSRRPPRDGDEL